MKAKGKQLTLAEIIDQLEEDSDDDNFDYDRYGENVKTIDYAMMPPLPRDEKDSDGDSGDSDDSDSPLGSCNKLNKQLLESNAELLVHKQDLG